ncbi:MFS transporter [Sphingomonas koreensis]|nr:MFS transporter [Sphingomonas koreensis]
MLSERESTPWGAIAACFLAAWFEGLDIQSMGVAAPKIAPFFHIGPQAMGFVLSASIVGLMVGAALGGWMSDQAGRRTVLVASLGVLGIFSLGTSFVGNYDSLLLMRLLAGIGLGGVFPNLIAITSEIAPPRIRTTALALVYCGMPAGGAVAAWLTSITAPDNWHAVFQVGGAGPLFVIPLLLAFVPKYRPVGRLDGAPGNDRPRRIAHLFGARTRTTLLLWVAYFFTLFAVYLLLNWLPSLMMIGKGMTRDAAAQSALVLNLGAVFGSLILGLAVDMGKLRWTLISAYSGMAIALVALVVAHGPGLQFAVFATGFFVIGGQLVLYALGPMVYPIMIRGSGIGAAVAAGRAGSILGPILAGLVLARGLGAAAVPAIAIPGIAIALVATLLLVSRQPEID